MYMIKYNPLTPFSKGELSGMKQPFLKNGGIIDL